MLRLILREERHELRGEYFARLAVVCLATVLVLMVIWSFVLLSLYAQVRIDKKIAEADLASIQDSELINNREEAIRLSQLIKEKISYIDDEVFNPALFVDLITDAAADADRSGSISIDKIEINFKEQLDGDPDNSDTASTAKNFAEISVAGVASSRGGLVNFQQTLNAMKIFNKVETPYSSFASNVNIPFDMKIESADLSNLSNLSNLADSSDSTADAEGDSSRSIFAPSDNSGTNENKNINDNENQ